MKPADTAAKGVHAVKVLRHGNAGVLAGAGAYDKYRITILRKQVEFLSA